LPETLAWIPALVRIGMRGAIKVLTCGWRVNLKIARDNESFEPTGIIG